MGNLSDGGILNGFLNKPPIFLVDILTRCLSLLIAHVSKTSEQINMKHHLCVFLPNHWLATREKLPASVGSGAS